MILQTISTSDGQGISLVWFAATAFSIALILIGVVWRQGIAQQKEQLAEQKEQSKILLKLAEDIAVMKNNSTHTAEDVKAIRGELDGVKHDVSTIDKRVYALEIVK